MKSPVRHHTRAAANGVPYPYSGFCAPALAAIAPYPQLAAAEANVWFYPNLHYVGLPLEQSYYDSMVLQLNKRLSSGLTLNLDYTFSRSEGDTVNNFGESYGVASIQDFSNLTEAAHTLTPYDQKHTFKGAVTYELPFGRGRKFFTDNGKFVNGLISGWRVSGLVLYASGAPLSFSSSNYYYYPLWATTYTNYNLTNYYDNSFVKRHFHHAVGRYPSRGKYGDAIAPRVVRIVFFHDVVVGSVIYIECASIHAGAIGEKRFAPAHGAVAAHPGPDRIGRAWAGPRHSAGFRVM